MAKIQVQWGDWGGRGWCKDCDEIVSVRLSYTHDQHQCTHGHITTGIEVVNHDLSQKPKPKLQPLPDEVEVETEDGPKTLHVVKESLITMSLPIVVDPSVPPGKAYMIQGSSIHQTWVDEVSEWSKADDNDTGPFD